MSQTMESPLLEAAEAAEYLRVSRALLYEMHRDEKCPAPVRMGRRVLWRKDELLAWVNAGCPERAAWERRKAAQ
ncbi:MAG: helix-turn-helix domain-containing protein [Planctomycetes bacterium]|nr:helix-turn-helix domain-containing protein [Planctomycetota bacterium]MCW8134236.1 helix-turn-helix domain-containing protein [Planctomycetota bacterium]